MRLQAAFGRRSRFASALVAVLVVVGACSSTPSSSGGGSGGPAASHKQGDLLTLSIGVDPNHLDPALINSGQGTNINDYMTQTLTTYFYSPDKLSPLLATDWSPNADLSEWTFTLRSGVKFHDGTPFNADAVKKSIERVLDPSLKVVTSNDIKYVKTVTVIDDTHVKFTLTQPVSFFPSALSNQTSAITSPASWTANGNTYQQAEKVVGTGPYKLVEYVVGDHVLLQRNDDYWGEKAYYKQQRFNVIADAPAREAGVRSGQLQLATNIPAPSLDSLRADPNFTVFLPYGRKIYMGFNMQTKTNAPLLDKRVRQALNYAVDKDAIVKNVLFGAGAALSAPVSDKFFGYCKTGPYGYDAAKAKQMLADAGAANLTVNMISPTGRYLQDIQVAEAVAGYLRAVGVTVNGPTTADSATYQGMVAAPPDKSTTELFIWSFAADFPDAGQVLGRTLVSTSIPPQPGINYTHYSNPMVDQLTAQGAKDTTETARAASYCSALKLIWDDSPEIFLYDQLLPTVYTKSIKGVTAGPNGVINTVYAEPV